MPTLGEMHPELLAAKNAALADMKKESIAMTNVKTETKTPATPAQGMDLSKMESMLAAMQAQITQMAEENAALKAAATKKPSTGITVRLNALGQEYTSSKGEKGEYKGTIAVYGMAQFPTSLYCEQWLELFAHGMDEILAIIEARPVGMAIKNQARFDLLLKVVQDKLGRNS